MAYYPKSQIKTNLFTPGKQLQIVESQEEYIGHYWKTSKGEYFSGKSPSDSPSISLELIPVPPTPSPSTVIIDNNSSKVYNKLKNVSLNTELKLPFYQKNFPTSEDYEIGNVRRYFAKKENENIYIEINKEVYNKLSKKDPEYAFNLYITLSFLWKIKGSPEEVKFTNEKIVNLVEKNNKIEGLGKYLKFNFLEFYK
jgi:hypothetical protein